jgi:hypothetical protein
VNCFIFKRRSTPHRKPYWPRLGAVLLFLLAFNLQAQDEKPLLNLDELPEARHLVASLSDQASRTDTLLTMIAVARLMEYGVSADWNQLDAMEFRFRDERAWLDRLADRYQELPLRGSTLDPAAWFVLMELDQQQISPGLDISPLGPESTSLIRQLFDRADERLAAAVLPELLHRMELHSASLWSSLLESASTDEVLHELVLDLNSEWFDPWVAAEPPAPAGLEESSTVIDDALLALDSLAVSVMAAGPPDALRLKRLRYNLLSKLPLLNEVEARDAGYLLKLATGLDGLHEKKYLAFTESLLWVVSDLLLTVVPVSDDVVEAGQEGGMEPGSGAAEVPENDPAAMPENDPAAMPENDPEAVPENDPEAVPAARDIPARSQIPRALSDLLPALSNAFAGEFSRVDPRINASLAAVFDVVQYLQSGPAEQDRLTALRREIADAIAQLVLLIPDMNYYFDQPVRREISEEINICTSIAANSNQQEASRLSREQFDGCLDSLADMAGDLVRKEELAGDPDGPFGTDQLRRELMMAPWQRINYALGYLHERFPSACDLPTQPIPNPLEWSSLATMISWFARQSPVYFQTPENEALIVQLRQQGLELLQDLLQQVDCISGEGTGINDPVTRSLIDYRLALNGLVAGIRESELEFRSSRLAPGADVVLHGDASQQTAYRSEDLKIRPCRPDRVCEMSGELEATRALIGLFPDPYLIADQTGLGKMEICYDNMQWVDRRAEAVRQDDTHVANYFGKLSFDLIGRFRENGSATNVFGSNFVSPDEYHYLFAAATDEVLDDSCPVEWVGSRIVTGLYKSGAVRVVPDRLTYLASARSQPSQIINANWSRGAEWRDWFVTDLGVTPFTFELDRGISDRVNQHLHALYQAEQSALYNALLRPRSRSGRSQPGSLFSLQEELTARKALLRSYMNLFYPRFMIDSDEIRGSLEGHGALLDTAVLRRFREGNTAVSSINESGISRLEKFQANWARQPDVVRRSGSIATSVAHAITRLNDLYIEFFAAPPVPPEQDEEVSPYGGPRR